MIHHDTHWWSQINFSVNFSVITQHSCCHKPLASAYYQQLHNHKIEIWWMSQSRSWYIYKNNLKTLFWHINSSFLFVTPLKIRSVLWTHILIHNGFNVADVAEISIIIRQVVNNIAQPACIKKVFSLPGLLPHCAAKNTCTSVSFCVSASSSQTLHWHNIMITHLNKLCEKTLLVLSTSITSLKNTKCGTILYLVFTQCQMFIIYCFVA